MKKKKKDSLKIAMIGHKRIPSREGGVEIVVDELSSRYARQGHQVDAYNRSGYHVSGKEFDEKREKYYKGIRIITIPTFSSSKLNAICYSVLATLRAMFGRYDVRHFHAEGPCIMLWLPKLFGRRVIATIHGLDWQRAKWGNFASAVLKAVERTAVKHAPIKREADQIREKYGLEKDGYILFLARIVPEKGLHYLVKAYQKLSTDKKLVIAGGSSHSVEYMNKITRMVENDKNIIMTGFVQGEILGELYSNAYCFVLPSDIEGMALSLLEAMSYGNCCIISDIPENTEVAEDMALRFPKGDTEKLRAVLERAIKDEGLVRYYKENSQEFICKKYNWDKVAEKTLRLYQNIP